MLIIVATPIGNLKDITQRAIESLQAVDAIICEDTRRTAILLNHYKIRKPMLVINDFNESKTFPQIIERLKSGQNLALVSDAGTPLISDPGYKLVRECIAQNIEVDSIPGPASPIVALTLSGLPPDKFMFLGYLPEKSGQRHTLYQKLIDISKIQPTTFIAFISPFKLKKPLEEMKEFFGDISVTVASELTKIHQSVKSQPISKHLVDLTNKNPKGEYILLFNLTNPI